MNPHPAFPARPNPATSVPGRVLGVVEVALGLVTVARSRRIATGSWWLLDRRAMTATVAVLGTRQVLQGLVTFARPGPGALLVGAGVDGLHAASMLPVAFASDHYRRAARHSAALALGTAAAGVVLGVAGRS